MIFSRVEMERRRSAFLAKLASLGVDAAFVHTADNAYYLSGVPLLSEWGRPLWLVISSEASTIVCAQLELQNVEASAPHLEVRAYADEGPAQEQALGHVIELISIGQPKPTVGIERKLLPLGLWEALVAGLPGARFVDLGPALEE